jgi:hypothetical protein
MGLDMGFLGGNCEEKVKAGARDLSLPSFVSGKNKCKASSRSPSGMTTKRTGNSNGNG